MRQHPVYLLACLGIAIALQLILTFKLRSSMTAANKNNRRENEP